MTPRQAIKHFGSQTALAAALNISQPAVSNWVKRGNIPAPKQIALAAVTDGALKASRQALRELSLV